MTIFDCLYHPSPTAAPTLRGRQSSAYRRHDVGHKITHIWRHVEYQKYILSLSSIISNSFAHAYWHIINVIPRISHTMSLFLPWYDPWMSYRPLLIYVVWTSNATKRYSVLLMSPISNHYNDVIIGAIVSQITSLAIVFSTVYLGTDQGKYQSSAALAFVWGNHRRPVNSPHKWPVMQKMFPYDDVIMVVLFCSVTYQMFRI